MTKKLIGVGRCTEHRAEDVHRGDLLMWNYGFIEQIEAVTPRGKTQLVLKGRTLGRYGDLVTACGFYGDAPKRIARPETGMVEFTRVINRATTVVKVRLDVTPNATNTGLRREVQTIHKTVAQ
jgi:hypothetical protein